MCSKLDSQLLQLNPRVTTRTNYSQDIHHPLELWRESVSKPPEAFALRTHGDEISQVVGSQFPSRTAHQNQVWNF